MGLFARPQITFVFDGITSIAWRTTDFRRRSGRVLAQIEASREPQQTSKQAWKQSQQAQIGGEVRAPPG
jgi:hypothetical protein